MSEDLAWKRFYGVLVNPFWADPAVWTWVSRQQLIRLDNLRDKPGILNLVWLSMDLSKPVDGYDMSQNHLAVWIMTTAHNVPCEGVTLEAFAAMHSLQRFATLVSNHSNVQKLVAIARKKCQEKV